jgi:hypothetical protein
MKVNVAEGRTSVMARLTALNDSSLLTRGLAEKEFLPLLLPGFCKRK